MRATDHAAHQKRTNEKAEAQCVHVRSFKELARDYVIVGIKGKLLRVRRKSDGAEFWLTVSQRH